MHAKPLAALPYSTSELCVMETPEFLLKYLKVNSVLGPFRSALADFSLSIPISKPCVTRHNYLKKLRIQKNYILS